MRFKDYFDLDPVQIRKEAGRVRKANSHLVRKTSAHEDKVGFNKKKDRKHFNQKLRSGVYENHTLTNVRLTDHQKSVLANILARDNQNTTLVDLVSGVEQIHKQNIASAVNTLEKIGLISLQGKELTITDSGMNVLNDENMVDDGGMLSPDGQKYQFMFTGGEEGKTQDDVNQEMGLSPTDNATDPMNQMQDMNMEPPADLGIPTPQMSSATFSLRDAMKFIYS